MAKLVKANFFKLDSNIDGSYVDRDGVLKQIPNMIQSVGATDGPAAYPNSSNVNAKFDGDEVDSINGLTTEVSISGHGILYNENGEPYAHKGDMVLRDGKGNVANLNRMFLKANTINERDKTVFMRDKSLQEYNSGSKGLDLNEFIEATVRRSAAFGVGNIKQAVRNTEADSDVVSVQTVKMSDNNNIWVVGTAMITGPSIIRLIDLTTNTVLDTSYVEPKDSNITPAYCSYYGTLQIGTDTDNVSYQCNDPIWNSYVKRFYRYKDQVNTFSGIHTIALEVNSGPNFVRGSINMMVSDDGAEEDDVINGKEIVNNVLEWDIKFDSELSSSDYAITIQTDIPIQHWYSKDDKTESGFKIKFEREYSGRILWSAIQ